RLGALRAPHWDRQRFDRPASLAVDVQPFAARRHDAEIGAASKELLGQRAHGHDQVFGVVDQQEHSTVADGLHEARNGLGLQPEPYGGSVSDAGSIVDGSKIDECDIVWTAVAI